MGRLMLAPAGLAALTLGASTLGALTLGTVAAQAAPSAYVAAAVADPGRPAADTARDATRKPADVLAFSGVKPGDVVGEIMPGGGYYTRLLSKVVGPKGKVYAMVPDAMAKFRPESVEALKAIGPNVVVLITPSSAAAAPEKLDLLWTSENYHDFHMSRPPAPAPDIAIFNKAALDSLKPGGVFLIEDHALAPGAGPANITLHRIDPLQVKSEEAAAGFKFQAESDVLKNPDDPHTVSSGDPSIRGHTDKLLMKFKKP